MNANKVYEDSPQGMSLRIQDLEAQCEEYKKRAESAETDRESFAQMNESCRYDNARLTERERAAVKERDEYALDVMRKDEVIGALRGQIGRLISVAAAASSAAEVAVNLARLSRDAEDLARRTIMMRRTKQ